MMPHRRCISAPAQIQAMRLSGGAGCCFHWRTGFAPVHQADQALQPAPAGVCGLQRLHQGLPQGRVAVRGLDEHLGLANAQRQATLWARQSAVCALAVLRQVADKGGCPLSPLAAGASSNDAEPDQRHHAQAQIVRSPHHRRAGVGHGDAFSLTKADIVPVVLQRAAGGRRAGLSSCRRGRLSCTFQRGNSVICCCCRDSARYSASIRLRYARVLLAFSHTQWIRRADVWGGR